MDAARKRLIGLALQGVRKAMGQQQTDVARALNLSASAVSWLENGRAEVSLDQVRQLAEFWEMPYVTLLERLGFPIDRSAPSFDEWYRGIHASTRHATHASAPAAPQNGDSGSDLSTPMGRKQSFRHLPMLRSGSPRFAPSLG